ncbi:MAG: glycosyltransferase [Bacteroidetes bacterium]|nr:glycosyltransferase [Bacteroidota bacterium]
MSTPLVSVIVSTYNSELFIKGRLEDLVQQTIFDRLEIIVVNSGSQQGEEPIILEYAARYGNIKYLKTQERESIYMAWNRGIRAATGRFITNANADDRLRQDALQVLSDALIHNPEVALVYGDQYVSTVPNAVFSEFKGQRYHSWNNFQYERLLEGCFTGPQPMWRASLHFEDDLWFDEEYEVAGDYEFSCAVALRYPLLHIKQVLGVYYLSPTAGNKEHQNAERTFLETYRIKSSYADRYLNRMKEPEFYERYRYYRDWVRRPALLYYAWKLIMKIAAPDRRLPMREFAVWFAARMDRLLGNFPEAVQTLQSYLNRKGSRLLDEEVKALTGRPESGPAVSVIIPTFNRPHLLRMALESLTVQTYRHFEVVVINNGGTDVADIVAEFRETLSVRLLASDVHGSVAHAKNIGLSEARGSYIAFLDDDDWYHPGHLETLMSEMRKGAFRIVYTDALVEFQDEIDGVLTTVKSMVQYSRDFSRTLLLVKDYIYTPCIMLDKRCLTVVGNFDESLRTDEDMDLWIRMSKYYDFKHLKTITCSVRRSNAVASLTRDWGMMLENLRYVYRKHDALGRYNPLVKLGQMYYVNLRIRRAKESLNGGYRYKY